MIRTLLICIALSFTSGIVAQQDTMYIHKKSEVVHFPINIVDSITVESKSDRILRIHKNDDINTDILINNVDSIVFYNSQLSALKRINFICEGDSYTFPDGFVKYNIVQDMVYISTFPDSIVEISLIINPVYSLADTVEIASGENHIFHDGTVHSNITANESYTSKFTSAYGCDSIIQTYVKVVPFAKERVTVQVCAGENYTFPDGTTHTNITKNKVYYSTLSTKVVVTTVKVNPAYSLKDTIEVASGENHIFHDGTVHSNITANESYTSNFTSAYGCDSIIQTYVKVVPFAKERVTVQVCAGENYTFPDGTTHTNITKKKCTPVRCQQR